MGCAAETKQKDRSAASDYSTLVDCLFSQRGAINPPADFSMTGPGHPTGFFAGRRMTLPWPGSPRLPDACDLSLAAAASGGSYFVFFATP
jgi:hypothetical protein